MGAWIEIGEEPDIVLFRIVAPFVGAWIEIFDTCIIYKLGTVAPFVGAWIEIHEHSTHWAVGVSLPSWERGLKLSFWDLSKT